jgi:acyl-homoserine-lactone acylase
VTIVRDRWGVAHVYGRSDADAVFGMIHAQAEDDFPRVERNYLVALGRLAEVEGEAEVWRDLRQKLYVDPDTLRAQYAASPAWLRALMDAWADGLNHYLATHPAVRPALLTRFEPWMALAFTEGSIGGDVESVSLGGLERFYGARAGAAGDTPNDARGGAPGAAPARPPGDSPAPAEPGGSNGFALGPSVTASGRAMLLINPHTSFYFRPEVHVVSREGLNAYGAVTWGQFFVYQGFNDRAGWMHTSGGADVIDEYLEAVTDSAGRVTYRFGAERRPMRARVIALPYRLPSGGTGEAGGDGVLHAPRPRGARRGRAVGERAAHVGPDPRAPAVVPAHEGALVRRVRARDGAAHQLVEQHRVRRRRRHHRLLARQLRAACATPRSTTRAGGRQRPAHRVARAAPRPPRRCSSGTRRAGGSRTRTTRRGSAAGPYSPRRERYPKYMWELPENPRGVHAVRVLTGRRGFTLDSLIRVAYDPDLPAFDALVPALARDFDALPAGDTLRAALGEQVALLRAWDRRWSAASVPTSLAVYWGEALMARTADSARAAGADVYAYMASDAARAARLPALAAASARIARDFGTWRTPWGEINRFQRLANDAAGARHDDAKPSLPVPFTSAVWGSLASIGQRAPRTTRRIYGDYGNSFVAVVEFGPRVRARSVLAGGVSGDPRSPHFADQAAMYARGAFKDVAFHREDVERQRVRAYHPGGALGRGPGARLSARRRARRRAGTRRTAGRRAAAASSRRCGGRAP